MCLSVAVERPTLTRFVVGPLLVHIPHAKVLVVTKTHVTEVVDRLGMAGDPEVTFGCDVALVPHPDQLRVIPLPIDRLDHDAFRAKEIVVFQLTAKSFP